MADTDVSSITGQIAPNGREFCWYLGAVNSLYSSKSLTCAIKVELLRALLLPASTLSSNTIIPNDEEQDFKFKHHLILTNVEKSRAIINNRSRRPVTTQSKVVDETSGRSYPKVIQAELFSRICSFFGSQGFSQLEEAFVVVVGLGGVGSHAANMLTRSGVGRLRLIDFDQVTLSSLNRHAMASMSDVGQSKADVLKRKLLEVVPWARIESVTEMFRGADAARLLEGNPTYVVDCIDDVSTKADLIAYCIKNNIKIITSMGAGGKADPTRLRISALSDCINDPLAAKIKWKLKKHSINAEDVMAVFSIEKPVVDLLPLDEEQAKAPQDYGVVDYMRLRVVPVLGTSPSIFGQALASFILCSVAGRPYEPAICESMSKNLKHKMKQTFKNNELKRFKTTTDIDLDDDDIEFIVNQVWRGRCAVTGRKFGGHSPLVLVRWVSTQLPTPGNVVLLMPEQAQLFMDSGEAAFSAAALETIRDRLTWAERIYSDSIVQTLSSPQLASRASLHGEGEVAWYSLYSTQSVVAVGSFMLGLMAARFAL